MVTYTKGDLEFILDQIKLSEAHAAGQPLYGPGGLITDYNDSLGLRTVDGTYNNLLPGQETWGAANQEFVEVLDPVYRDVDPIPMGPGVFSADSYAPSDDPSNLVVDGSVRTISNLIADQTLGNPAAILRGIELGGLVEPTLANLEAVKAIYQVFKPFADMAYQTRVVAVNARQEADAYMGGDPIVEAELEAAALQAETDAANALADLLQARETRDAALDPYGIVMDGDNVSITNVAPDEGLSAPFNSWFTLFGQFFDHGLDLVNKGGSGTVFVPLSPDDPLYVEGSSTNFMVLTRSTVSAGEDGVMGTEDDVRPVNITTPFVDQNQTYTSHSSHQVFLRQYVANADGAPVETGKLIEGGGAEPGGMATWGEVKEQARTLLGIDLTDFDVGNVPLLRTDEYGNFIRDANGMPQIIVGIGPDGIPNTADDDVVSGDTANPVDPTAVGALRTGHPFLADIAHDAVPEGKVADGDITIGLANPGNGSLEYDNELLDAHFIAGDGRANENIGLTAVHTLFHTEHNRMVDHTKDVIVSDAQDMLAGGASAAEAVAFLNEWLAVDVTEVPVDQAAVDALTWDGARLFQAAKFGTEMQYQHAVFEDFARKIQPNIDFFIVPDGYHVDINPSIMAEFAHVVYRFGHSMLNEDIARFDSSFNDTSMGLIEGFLNPIAFDQNHTITDEIAAGDIVRGMTRQVGNEIDEFVTTALRNNLLGLPLDLATLNLARARETGVPSLNEARRQFYEDTQQAAELKPYESWTEFAANLKNEASVINFIAAYGTHQTILDATTMEEKRDAAMELVFGVDFNGDDSVPADRLDFLNSAGAYANDPALNGIEDIDFWIGGLAEATLPFGGMLGSTFGFIFEMQLEALQDGDRFYYLQRLDGLDLFAQMENNTLSEMIQRNFEGVGHLPSDVFSTPGLILEVDQSRQFNEGLGSADPTTGSLLNPDVVRDNPATPGLDTNYLRYNGDEHVLLGGTDQDDTLIGSIGDDTLYGDDGNDRMEGGAGNDLFRGGDGDDIITDFGGDDIIRSGAGHDAINAGQGLDLVVADAGNDFIVLGDDDLDEAFGGTGNDFILGSKTTEQSMGGDGHDWIEIGAWTGAVGDNFEQDATDKVKGHDVFHGDGGFDEFIGEGGDDIWVQSLGRGKFDGLSGFDWTSAADMKFGQVMDLNIQPTPGADNALQDVFTNVEGVSGSAYNDTLIGTDVDSVTIHTEGFRGSVLDAEGIALIDGLQEVVGAGVTMFDGGNILLGGAGSDVIEGRGGDDIIDGDKWLNVRISVRESYDENGPIGAEIATANSMKELSAAIFAGQINPGQLLIVREILTADPSGDLDIAVFSGNMDEYAITANFDGSFIVDHVGGTGADGTDHVRNVEFLRFADIDLSLVPNLDGLVLLSDMTPTEGQTITADTGGIINSDGITPFTYEWQVSTDGSTWTEIAGAASASFTPTQDQVGQLLRVSVTYQQAGGVLAEAISDATDPTGDLMVGTVGSDVLLGTAGQDDITGLAGNDFIDGREGADTMRGGAGDDRFYVDNAGDVVIEEAGEGNDQIRSTVSFNLADDVEVETLRAWGTDGVDLTGNNLDNIIIGNDASNQLDGAAGNDIINGGGGADLMSGGLGNDRFFIDNAGDVVVENSGEGTDQIRASIDYVLSDTIAVESLRVEGNGNPVNLTGNSLGNVLLGNDAVNQLSGGAGNDFLNGLGGADVMNGGTGDDRFYVDDAADVVLEAAGEGRDEVRTSIDYTLADGAEVEIVRAWGSGLAIDLTGNSGANTMLGNNAANVLNGGAGSDMLNGGAGDDTVIQFSADGGRDIVDGGAGMDTYHLMGSADAEDFVIYSRAAALGAIAGLDIGSRTEIVVTRDGEVIAELDNIEEISVNSLDVSTPGGSSGGTSEGDTVTVVGNFDSTSLNFNTITIDGGAGNDTVDISGLTSAHRIVFTSNGGQDKVVGDLRPQDVVDFDTGSNAATEASALLATMDMEIVPGWRGNVFSEFRSWALLERAADNDWHDLGNRMSGEFAPLGGMNAHSGQVAHGARFGKFWNEWSDGAELDGFDRLLGAERDAFDVEGVGNLIP